jgi:hypothetical protein
MAKQPKVQRGDSDGVGPLLFAEVPLSRVRPSDYRHPPFGEASRPFFERMVRIFGDVLPGDVAKWEDDFRRDMHPEREMAIWSDVATHYLHFTEGRDLRLDQKRDILSVLMACTYPDPEAVLEQCVKLRTLSKKRAKEIVEHVYRSRASRASSPGTGAGVAD